jgi:hypothetical protein
MKNLSHKEAQKAQNKTILFGGFVPFVLLCGSLNSDAGPESV